MDGNGPEVSLSAENRAPCGMVLCGFTKFGPQHSETSSLTPIPLTQYQLISKRLLIAMFDALNALDIAKACPSFVLVSGQWLPR